MVSLRTPLPVALFVTLAWRVAGNGFLSPVISTAEIDDDLKKIFVQHADEQRVEDFIDVLSPYYVSLPKNADGNLHHQTARYFLHRLFVGRHGWYIKGLEPNGDPFHADTPHASFKDWVPSYLMDHFEKQVGHKGLNLHDLAVLAAALEDLVHKEAINLTAGIYQELTKSPFSDGSPKAQDVALIYLASYLSNAHWSAKVAVINKDVFIKGYHDWTRTVSWFQNTTQNHASTGDELQLATKMAIDIGAHYGTFNDLQCTELKAALMGMWAKAKTTGRIRLVDFYRVGLDTQWDLVEKREYLRALGALDESNASSPLVIIPNYLTAKPNCLDSTNLYATCCRNECEILLGELERRIAAPAAAPEEIIELVSDLGTDTVTAPRQLDSSLVERLHSVANTHGGKVKLHGRLFAQWMHHAYPNECPYPHEAGHADPSSPDAWMGAEVAASEEERKKMVEEDTCGPEEAAAEWTGELPWSHTDELLPHHTTERGGVLGALKIVGLPIALMIVAVLLAAGGKPGMLAKKGLEAVTAGHKVSRKHMLLAALSVIAVVTNMINVNLLAVMVCVGLVMQRALALGAQRAEPKLKEKCMV